MRTGELRQYHYFLLLAQELHFGRAAALSFITQPALSQQIARLEAALGVRLFEREQRHVRLTPAGEVLRDGVQQMFQLLDETTRRAREAAGFAQHRLILGLIEYANLPLLPSALSALHRLYPEVTLQRQEMHTDVQMEALLRRQIDVGLAVLLDGPGPRLPPDGALQAQRLLASPWRLLVREDHPLARSGALSLEQLSRERVILFARDVNPTVYDSLLQAWPHPNIVYETRQSSAGVQLARQGLGGLLATGMVLAEAIPGMVALPLPAFAPLAIYLLWRADEQQPLVLDFVEFMQEQAAHHALTPAA